jgi:hypothetical protein
VIPAFLSFFPTRKQHCATDVPPYYPDLVAVTFYSPFILPWREKRRQFEQMHPENLLRFQQRMLKTATITEVDRKAVGGTIKVER